jgi:CheY-like chemotaxis protein
MDTTVIDILLVDDSQEDRDLAMHALRAHNLANHITVARDGKEALDFLFCRGTSSERSFKCPPRLVLLDLKLQKIDGMQVLQQIKGDSRTRSIPVVMMTSSREERDVLRSYDLGANSYIQKPVEFDEFRSVVKSLGLYWLAINQAPPGKGQETVAHGS